jgi:hypothetical protein
LSFSATGLEQEGISPGKKKSIKNFKSCPTVSVTIIFKFEKKQYCNFFIIPKINYGLQKCNILDCRQDCDDLYGAKMAI